jgi:plastin-1
MCEKKEFILW